MSRITVEFSRETVEYLSRWTSKNDLRNSTKTVELQVKSLVESWKKFENIRINSEKKNREESWIVSREKHWGGISEVVLEGISKEIYEKVQKIPFGISYIGINREKSFRSNPGRSLGSNIVKEKKKRLDNSRGEFWKETLVVLWEQIQVKLGAIIPKKNPGKPKKEILCQFW